MMIGAEGWAEASAEPWLRPATPDERESFDLAARACGKGGLRALSRDRTGRPYALVAVLPEAPEGVYKRAEKCWRLVRLESLSD